jgi:hypothetical protein
MAGTSPAMTIFLMGFSELSFKKKAAHLWAAFSFSKPISVKRNAYCE